MANRKFEFDTDGFQYYNDNYVKHPSKSATTGTSGAHPYNGMGRVVLKKNMVSNVNTLTQAMINTANTIYVIKYDYILGANITVPANCVLEFDGGSLSGAYTITGNNTGIIANNDGIFDNTINIAGTWNVSRITSTWFKNLSGTTNRLQEMFHFLRDDLYQEIIVEDGIYNFRYENPRYGQGPIELKSNTKLIFDGTINFDTYNNDDTMGYMVIRAMDKHDIVITGSGTIHGDRETNDSETEWGHGIGLISSTSGKVKNILVENITVEYVSGDNINLGYYPENVEIRNCTIKYGRRNGISVFGGKNFNIHDNYFEGIGMPVNNIPAKLPKTCIELEADGTAEGTITENLSIYNNNFKTNCIGILVSETHPSYNINICNNIMDDIDAGITLGYKEVSVAGDFLIHNVNVENNRITNAHNCCFNITADKARVVNNVFIHDENKPSSTTVAIFGKSDNYMEGLIFEGNIVKAIQPFKLHYCSYATIKSNVIEESNYTAAARNEYFAIYCFNSVINNNSLIFNIGKFGGDKNVIQNNSIKLTGVAVSGGYTYVGEDGSNNIITNNDIDANSAPNFVFYIRTSDNNKFIKNRITKNSFDQYTYFKDGTITNLIIRPEKEVGTTAERPSQYIMTAGTKYYDTDLNKEILWNGTAWVDATGTLV